MKILLLGATGRTGNHVLYRALAAGITVHALVRDVAKAGVGIQSLNLKRFEGNPLDRATLRTAMSGCDAVLSTLNISRTSDFPWSRLRTPPDFLSATMRNVIDVAGELGIRRIIVTTAWGVNETKKDIPFWFRCLIDYSNIGVAYRDHERQEHLLEASSSDWTAIRPVGLTNSRKDKNVIVTVDNVPRPNLTISRYILARFMIESCYKSETYTKQAITISEE